MIYPYLCDSCQKEFDVVKSYLHMDDPEKCDCGSKATRQFTARVHIIGAQVTNAEYNPGLGCVVKNKAHKDDIMKRKGVVEVGNDYGSSEKLQKKFETDRAEKIKKRLDGSIE